MDITEAFLEAIEKSIYESGTPKFKVGDEVAAVYHGGHNPIYHSHGKVTAVNDMGHMTVTHKRPDGKEVNSTWLHDGTPKIAGNFKKHASTLVPKEEADKANPPVKVDQDKITNLFNDIRKNKK